MSFSLFKSTYTVATSKETEHIAHKNQCFKIFFRRDSSLEPFEIQERKEAAAVTSAGKGVFGVHFPGKKSHTNYVVRSDIKTRNVIDMCMFKFGRQCRGVK